MGRRLALVLVAVAALTAGTPACSDGDESSSTTNELVMPTTTTSTTAVGAEPAPTSTFLPNTPVVSGQEAILTGSYSQEPRPGDVDGSGAEDPCHFLTTDDGARVSVAFTDTYLYGGVVYPGPADYPGDPERYADDPLLVHTGDRIAVRGEAVEVADDPCATATAPPGLTVLVSTFAPS